MMPTESDAVERFLEGKRKRAAAEGSPLAKGQMGAPATTADLERSLAMGARNLNPPPMPIR